MGAATFEPPMGGPGYHRALSRNRGPYRTKDGYLSVSTIQDRHWQRFCRAIPSTAISDDPRFKDQASRVRNSEALCDAISGILDGASNKVWLDRLQAAEVPAAALNTLQGLISDSHLNSKGFIRSLEHPTEGTLRALSHPVIWENAIALSERPAPRLGEHTVEVLLVLAGL
jgi:crotonobetainyl-CoA:carnitine CoA-transferase CaiB-like acyl-CoA transferase